MGDQIDTSPEAIAKLLDGVTEGRAVQFHGSYCKEAADTPFSDWDTSHDVSVIRPDGTRYRLAHFSHAVDAEFYQLARTLVPALAARLAEVEVAFADIQRNQTYRYIGRDGKPVLARDLEDRAEAAEAALKDLADTCASVAQHILDHKDAPARIVWPGVFADLQRAGIAAISFLAKHGAPK